MTRRSHRVLLAWVLAVLVATCLGPLPTAGAFHADQEPVGTWPLSPEPAVVKPFDPPAERWLPGHRGVDLAGRVGQPVRSALPGTVRWAGRLAGRGIVVVSHGDTRTTYEPVTASLAVGTPVEAGAVIGTLERLGSHCLPAACLHWGWLRGDAYLNPLLLVGGLLPVRLLPLNSQDSAAPGPPISALGQLILAGPTQIPAKPARTAPAAGAPPPLAHPAAPELHTLAPILGWSSAVQNLITALGG